MAKRIIQEGILVVRDGKRIRPQIGKAFDLTAEEIKQLEAIRPSAIANLREIEDDPASTPTDNGGDQTKATKGRGRTPKSDGGDAGSGDPAGDL